MWEIDNDEDDFSMISSVFENVVQYEKDSPFDDPDLKIYHFRRFKASNFRRVIPTSYEFLRVLDDDLMEMLDLEKVQGIFICKRGVRECLLINDKVSNGFFAVVNDDLLRRRIYENRILERNESLECVNFFLMALLLIVAACLAFVAIF